MLLISLAFSLRFLENFVFLLFIPFLEEESTVIFGPALRHSRSLNEVQK
jgi:hypothetical protein